KRRAVREAPHFGRVELGRAEPPRAVELEAVNGVGVALHHEELPLLAVECEPVGVAERPRGDLAAAVGRETQQAPVALLPLAGVRDPERTVAGKEREVRTDDRSALHAVGEELVRAVGGDAHDAAPDATDEELTARGERQAGAEAAEVR